MDVSSLSFLAFICAYLTELDKMPHKLFASN